MENRWEQAGVWQPLQHTVHIFHLPLANIASGKPPCSLSQSEMGAAALDKCLLLVKAVAGLLPHRTRFPLQVPLMLLCSAMLSPASTVSTALCAPHCSYKSLQEHLRTKKLLVFALLPSPSPVTHNTFVQGFINKAFFNINLGRKSCSSSLSYCSVNTESNQSAGWRL